MQFDRLSDMIRCNRSSFTKCSQKPFIVICIIETYFQGFVQYTSLIIITGTGKSTTGVRLAYLMARKNSSEEQVIYCGPSNKSVNVVTGEGEFLSIFENMLTHNCTDNI